MRRRISRRRRPRSAGRASTAAASNHGTPAAHAGGAAGDTQVAGILRWLRRHGTQRNRAGMARYAITARQVFGVSIADLRAYARRLGHDHALAVALWRTGSHEARLLAAFIDEPARITPAQMDRWARGFENWADCDSTCLHLFDRTPHAWRKVDEWSARREEFVKRAAFSLLASLAVHRREAPDDAFLTRLVLVERAATDGRNFVRKAVSWALRTIGKRNAALRSAAMQTAERLVASGDRTAGWVGRDALRALVEMRAPARRHEDDAPRRLRSTRRRRDEHGPDSRLP